MLASLHQFPPAPRPQVPTQRRAHCSPMASWMLALAMMSTTSACEPDVGNPEPQVDEELRPPSQCPLPALTPIDPGPLPEARDAQTPRATSIADDVTAWNSRCDVNSVGLHRLNRAELQHTYSAVLQLPALDVFSLPVDDSSDGFDNLADVLSVSPLLLEKLATISSDLVDEALAPKIQPKIQLFEAERLQAETGNPAESFYVMNGPGTLRMRPDLDIAGTYVIRIRAWGEQAGAAAPLMGVLVDDVPRDTFEVTSTLEAPGVYETTLTLGPDDSILGVSFANDYFYSSHPIESERDRNLLVDFIEVEGPLEVLDANASTTEDTALRRAILVCSPSDLIDDDSTPGDDDSELQGPKLGANACGTRIFERFAHLAWRRPATENELVRLLGFINTVQTHGTPAGEDPFEFGVRLGLRAILMSPNFLYRVELDARELDTRDLDPNFDPDEDADDDTARDTPLLLSDHALASRLSYFLWSGPPDARLLEIAARGRLQDDDVLQREVVRMLSDPKSRALVDNFGGQWLQTRAVSAVNPDVELFPEWTKTLARQASCETLNLFDHVLRTEAPITELVTAEYTFATPDLVAHYGLDVDDTNSPEGEGRQGGAGYERVSLADTERRGVLTHASVLAVTSNPTRTSPVKRGKWVLEQLMCITPPPPPPGVEAFPDAVDAQTLRERLEQHRENPMCASCHDLMDPIGLALENFDATGKWRTSDNGSPIDTSSTFFSGEPFEGHRAMIDLVVESDTIERCTATKMLIYALGRVTSEDSDWCAIDSITFAAQDRGGSLVDVVTEIALSAPFRMHRRSARDDVDEEDPSDVVDEGVGKGSVDDDSDDEGNDDDRSGK